MHKGKTRADRLSYFRCKKIQRLNSEYRPRSCPVISSSGRSGRRDRVASSRAARVPEATPSRVQRIQRIINHL